MKIESDNTIQDLFCLKKNRTWRVCFNHSIDSRFDEVTGTQRTIYIADYVDINKISKPALQSALQKEGYDVAIADLIFAGESSMKSVIYLAANDLGVLISDIQKVFPEYQGETDFSFEGGGIHLIGDIVLTTDEEGNPLTWVGTQHANIYVPDGFDQYVFEQFYLLI